MSTAAVSAPAIRRAPLPLLLRAGLLTGLTDGLFATVQHVVISHSVTFTRLWQGVASVLLGKEALNGGGRTAAIGLLMHFGVAFFWSAVFLFLALRLAPLRRTIASPSGVVAVASVYGPMIWIIMSLVVIPLFVHRAPTITPSWWVQLIGHMVFVGLPIVGTIGRGMR